MTTTNLTWRAIVPTVDGDTARMYVDARVDGLGVLHADEFKCFTHDSVDGLPGTFRAIGMGQFYKKSRRWSVKARGGDCTSIDLCTLIAAGLIYAKKFGQHLGHGLRGRLWNHGIGTCGDPSAFVRVSRRVTVDELLGSTDTAVTVPDSVHQLLSIGTSRRV